MSDYESDDITASFRRLQDLLNLGNTIRSTVGFPKVNLKADGRESRRKRERNAVLVGAMP